MRTACRAVVLAFAVSLPATTLVAQSDSYPHLGHVASAFATSPGGMGLLQAAISEAETAEQHARLAAADSVSLAVWRLHAGHALYALDPATVTGSGPGLGYGVRQAASEAAQHMELVLATDSLTENVALRAPRILSSLNNAVRWTDEAVALARSILSSPSVGAARPMVERLEALCEALLWGRDGDRDGIVGWEEGEGGLAQANYHMNLLRRAEGLDF